MLTPFHFVALLLLLWGCFVHFRSSFILVSKFERKKVATNFLFHINGCNTLHLTSPLFVTKSFKLGQYV